MKKQKVEPTPKAVDSDAVITTDNVESYRRLDCKQYDYCLVLACRNKWPSFHCRACPAYKQGVVFRATDYTHRFVDILQALE